MENGEGNFKMK